MSGFGSQPWGSGPWGGSTTPLAPTAIVAVAENLLQVTFNAPVYLSGLLDAPDSSNPALWQTSPVAGTVGYDGQPARAVSVVVPAIGAQPNVVLLTLDRPMSPYPSQYQLSLGQIYSADLSMVTTPGVAGACLGVYRQLNPQVASRAAPGRDFANPQTIAAAQAAGVATSQSTLLGTFGYSDDHDYAFDQGDAGFKKRMSRRIFTKKNGFAFLLGYGVGATSYAKRLSTPSVREQFAADCESQIAQEPEVASVTVSTRQTPNRPNLFRLSIFVKKKSGATATYSTLVSHP